jgi:isocitrate lyase
VGRNHGTAAAGFQREPSAADRDAALHEPEVRHRPEHHAITRDGIVRYVVVAQNRNGGGVNAFYEGVRCSTAELKSYARYNNGAWQETKTPEWKRINDLNSRYAKALSTQALCRGNAPRNSVGDMVQNLRNPVREVQ